MTDNTLIIREAANTAYRKDAKDEGHRTPRYRERGTMQGAGNQAAMNIKKERKKNISLQERQ